MDPKWRRVIAVVVVVGLIAAGIGIYFDVQYNLANQKCSLKSTNPIVVDQAEVAETADPDTAPSTPAWGLVQQIYQTLVMYNGSSLTQFSGVLAKNWTNSSDGFHWNFTLNSGVHFSNGDPFNAYVMWFSLYRLLDMYGINQYLLSENFWFPGVNYYSNSSQVSASAANITTALNTFKFFNPTPDEIAVMNAQNQSFRVLAPDEIQLNLGYGYLQANYAAFTVPYAYLLAEISTPGAAAVDPAVIQANGGVVQGSANSYMQDHAVGTGPYLLTSDTISGYTLTPDSNYWGAKLAAEEPWNNNIQPAQAKVQVNYQSQSSVTIQDLKSGDVATASFLYLGPSSIQQLQGIKCLKVQQLDASPANAPFSGANGAWWVFMNQSVYPFNNWSVRAAITHAINYNEVIQDAFGGYAFNWVGPVPPGHPDYNPPQPNGTTLTPYQYNLTLAKQEIANSPCANDHCAGLSFEYEYLSTSLDWQDAATIIQQNLAQIGITVDPIGVTLAQFYTEQTIDPSTSQCTSAEVYEGVGPFYIGQDFYSSDYISPDDWTQEDFMSFGSANICQSGFNSGASANYNLSLDNLVYEAAGTRNPTVAAQLYAQMTQIMYENYTNAWFACPYLFSVYNPAVTGAYQTPMGSTPLSTMSWNTVSV